MNARHPREGALDWQQCSRCCRRYELNDFDVTPFESMHPATAAVALRFLRAPATSVQSQRLFSATGLPSVNHKTEIAAAPCTNRVSIESWNSHIEAAWA